MALACVDDCGIHTEAPDPNLSINVKDPASDIIVCPKIEAECVVRMYTSD